MVELEDIARREVSLRDRVAQVGGTIDDRARELRGCGAYAEAAAIHAASAQRWIDAAQAQRAGIGAGPAPEE